jgi:hypothetical protein
MPKPKTGVPVRLLEIILFDTRYKCLIIYYISLKLLLKSRAVIKMKNNIRMFKMIAGIISVLLIGIPITMHAMSARPPEVSEQIEADGYLQKSYIDNRKTLIHDKNGNVVGYCKKLSGQPEDGCVRYERQHERVFATRSDGLPQAQVHQGMN